MKRVSLFCTLLCICGATLTLGQIPQTISYQGRLMQNGEPAPDGSYSVVFRLYTQASGGSAAWTEAQTVTASTGLFSVRLGTVNPLNLVFDRPYWLGISVAGGAEMSPRSPLASAPYSLYANTVIDNSISTAKLVDNSVTANKVLPNIVSSIEGVTNDAGNIDLVAGSNITITPSDAANTITIAATGTGGDITGVTAGTGLSGGGAAGDVTLNVAVPMNLTGSVAEPGGVVKAENTGNGAGLFGKGASGYGVLGESNMGPGVLGGSTSHNGVFARSEQSDALVAVTFGASRRAGIFANYYGQDSAFLAGPAAGVCGKSNDSAGVKGESVNSRGVYGRSVNAPGVRAESHSAIMNALEAVNLASSNHGFLGGPSGGVYGYSSDTAGVYGLSNQVGVEGRALGSSDDPAVGVRGAVEGPSPGSSFGVGVAGVCNGYKGVGVSGRGDGGWGVYGESAGLVGVEGTSTNGIGVSGSTTAGITGVWGSSSKTDGIGIRGEANHGPNAIGVKGISSGIGVRGEGTEGAGVHGYSRVCGVYGEADSSEGGGVMGVNASGSGVYGFSAAGTGVYGVSASADGLRGEASAANKSGIFALTTNPSGYAGYFTGRVHVNGTLSKASGAFKIDHPLDPENKYLQHSFVESPDMMNVYNGNAVLDGSGQAVVVLPDYFEALNKDFRYQLTCIGGFAPVYVSREISGNQFSIAGGTPGLKVSWQVTGIRKDAYANAHRIQVEEDKQGEERGRYLSPVEHGAAETLGIRYEERHQVRPGLAESQSKH